MGAVPKKLDSPICDEGVAHSFKNLHVRIIWITTTPTDKKGWGEGRSHQGTVVPPGVSPNSGDYMEIPTPRTLETNPIGISLQIYYILGTH